MEGELMWTSTMAVLVYGGGQNITKVRIKGILAILRRFRPDVVVGVGGYASGPMVLAAALFGYPTAIQEQNSVTGITFQCNCAGVQTRTSWSP
jgi:UDP-N-acetylglucosamine:LPS N-acetylglucosamine transferase